MFYRIAAILVALSFSPAAFAKADLDVDIVAPSGVAVYGAGQFDVTVSNIGNRNAQNVVLEVQLPETNTSPSVYVMGTVGAITSGCSLSGSIVTCNFGRIRKNQSASVSFDMSLPASAAPLTFVAVASTTSNENTLANNTDSVNASLTYYATPIAAPAAVVNRHCTGQGLTAFYECTLFPSSITSHSTVFEANGTITFVGAPPNYTGTWSQPTADSLVFDYDDGTGIVAQFSGVGVGGGCFEGLTTFPGGSPWVSPYEVCP